MENNTKKVTHRLIAVRIAVLVICVIAANPAYARSLSGQSAETATLDAAERSTETVVNYDASTNSECVTSIPEPPLPESASLVSDGAIGAEITLDGAKIGAGIRPLEDNELRAGHTYAIAAHIQTTRPVKNLHFKLQDVPRRMKAGETAVVTLTVMYEKKGVQHILNAKRTFTATGDIELDNFDAIFNSSGSSGVYTRVERGENDTLSFTFESNGKTPKSAFASATVWLTATAE